MSTKTKIGIGALILAAFVIGGFALNAYQVGAVENGDSSGHKFGFGRGRLGGFNGVDKDFPEWQAKMEERKAEMESWKSMTPEERQTKMEEFKANMPERPENGEWEGRGLGFGHLGFRGLKGFTDEANYEIVNLDNGVQITITSDNPDIVQKLHDFAAKHNK